MSLILIADDEGSIQTILTRNVEKMGLTPLRTGNGLEALEILKNQPVDVALVDIRMPQLTGLDLLSRKSEFQKNTHLILMTAQDTMENAIAAMKNGAFDYLTKPFDLAEVTHIIERALENIRLREELAVLKNSIPSNTLFSLVGKTKTMTEIFKTIGKLANQDVTVLIQGESGTGKELIARAIHTSGDRSNHPFVAVNCSAIPDNLLESELFGYKKGAFTGAEQDKIGFLEQANFGTILLDEIGDMPLSLQVKILRFLQDKTIQRIGETQTKILDVRVIAATHKNLKNEMQRGRFREDLFFRLNVVPIFVPPLRERRQDIPHLVEHFRHKYATSLALPNKSFAPDALDFFTSQDWPGNVRELENAIKRILVLSSADVITRNDVIKTLDLTPGSNEDSWKNSLGAQIESYLNTLPESENHNLYEKLLPLFEKPLLNALLRQTQGNQVKAADKLGINRNTLRKKLKDLDLL